MKKDTKLILIVLAGILAMLHGIWRLVRTLSGMIWKRSFR